MTQVPKAELLQRLFASGRGFKRILYASFLQVCRRLLMYADVC
jgi:hypothetical protein